MLKLSEFVYPPLKFSFFRFLRGAIRGASAVFFCSFLLLILVSLLRTTPFNTSLLFDGLCYRMLVGAIAGGILISELVIKKEKVSLPARLFLHIFAHTCLVFALFCTAYYRDSHGRQLYEAVEHGNVLRLKAVLEKGSDVNELDWYSVNDSPDSDKDWSDIPETIFTKAVELGNPAIVQVMLDHGANTQGIAQQNNTPLQAAIVKKRMDIVQLLVQHGANLFEKNLSDETLLMSAASAGDVVSSRYLLDHGLNINARDSGGMTALMKAASNGHDDVVSLLIARGAYFKLHDEGGKTAISYASQGDHPKTVRLLHGFGLKIGLYEAALMNDETAWKALINSGADLERKDDSGQTVLLRAANTMNKPLLDFLLEHGAKVDAKDADGKTSLMLIDGNSEKTVLSIMDSIISHGANINAIDNSKETALIIQASFGKAGMVEELLHHHADTSCCNDRGETALDCAREYNNKAIVSILSNAKLSR